MRPLIILKRLILKARTVPQFVLLILVLTFINPTHSHAQSGIVIDQLLTSLQRTLIRVSQLISDEDLPKLTKATLNLKSALRKEAGGKLSLFIVELGSGVSKHSTLEISLELRPPDASASIPASANFDLLSEAIIQSAKAVKRAQERKPKLLLHSLSVTVRFVVASSTESGIGFSILPITASIDGEVETEEVQELLLEFTAK